MEVNKEDKMKKNRLKIIYLGLGMVALLALLFFSPACQKVSNPLGPEPEITSTTNTTTNTNATQTSSTSTQTQDEFTPVKKPTSTPSSVYQPNANTNIIEPQVEKIATNNPKDNSLPQAKSKAMSKAKGKGTIKGSFKGNVKGSLSPGIQPPFELDSASIRPLRKFFHEKKKPKTFSNPSTSTPSSSDSDGEGDGDGDDDQSKRPSQELHIQVTPDSWNLNWVYSSGLVTVRFIGEQATTIDPESITLSIQSEDGSFTSEEEVAPAWTKINDSHLIAKFRKNEVIALLPDKAKAGDIFQVLINGEFISENGDSLNGDNSDGDGLAFSEPLTDTIMVVGQRQEDEDEYLTIKLTPKNWNPAWALQTTDNNDEKAGEDGYVVAHFKGEGIDDIVEGSTSLFLGTCDSPEGEPIPPVEEGLSEDGDEYHAYFEKSAAIGLIENPQPGDTYQVSIKVTAGSAGDETYCETFWIKIVGQSHELTVKIKPDRWNINWWKSEEADNDGDEEDEETIKVIFKGIGYNLIDPSSVQLEYAGNFTSASSFVNSELDEDDQELVVELKRADVLNLLADLDLKVGDTYLLIVHFTLEGTSTTREVSISIVGKKK